MSALLFNAAFGFYVVGLFHSVAGFLSRKELFLRIATASVVVAFGLHTAYLLVQGAESSLCPLLDSRQSLSVFAWTVSLCFLIAYRRYRVTALGIFLLPLVTSMLLGTVFVKASPLPEVLRGSWIYFHTASLFLAYGMFFVTFIAGVLYLLQERELKSKKPKTFYDRLPSLGTLDDLFLKFLFAGFTFMSFGLVAGAVWAEKQWVDGWFRDPKVLSAFTTWSIYLVLIFLRLSLGWRGRRAAWLGTVGFLAILFTFLLATWFGSQHKFS